VIWEPFGGLCSASLAAVTLGRRAFAAETDAGFADLAAQRLRFTQPELAHDLADRPEWPRGQSAMG
jgi:hypothetical protein